MTVILNLFQDLSVPQSIPHPTLSYLGEGIQDYPKADCSVCGKNVDENMMFSPLTLPLSLKGRGNSIIVRSTVKDSSLFTIHNSLPFDANLCLLQEGSET